MAVTAIRLLIISMIHVGVRLYVSANSYPGDIPYIDCVRCAIHFSFVIGQADLNNYNERSQQDVVTTVVRQNKDIQPCLWDRRRYCLTKLTGAAEGRRRACTRANKSSDISLT